MANAKAERRRYFREQIRSLIDPSRARSQPQEE